MGKAVAAMRDAAMVQHEPVLPTTICWDQYQLKCLQQRGQSTTCAFKTTVQPSQWPNDAACYDTAKKENVVCEEIVRHK